MPELVEVENYRQLLLRLKNNNSKKPCPLSIRCPSPTVPRVFLTQSELDTLQHYIIKDVERKGKLLRLVLLPADAKSERTTINLYLHMGMTGRISTPDYIPSLESLGETDSFPPPHTHLILESNGQRVAYSDPRRFGAISLGDPLSSQWDEFSTDALNPDASLEKLVGHRKGVKALLLDQRAIVCGVGNWIADEILYQSKIHPDQNYLTTVEVGNLKACLDMVLNTAIECLKAKQKFPNDWIFHRRWSKGKAGILMDVNGSSISFLKSGGRTSAIVPSIQKKQSRKPLTGAKAIATHKDTSEDPKKKEKAGGVKPSEADNQQIKRKAEDGVRPRRRSKRIAEI